MSTPSIHVMLHALQYLGSDPDSTSDQPIPNPIQENLRYDGTNPGVFEGHLDEKIHRRGDRVGPGKMTYDTGDVYDGEWAHDHMNGPGTFTKFNTLTNKGWLWQFVGTFSNDCPLSGTLIQRTTVFSDGKWREGTHDIYSDQWQYKTVFDQKPKLK